jgi:O-antigen/teichoic acid export membrane protein
VSPNSKSLSIQAVQSTFWAYASFISGKLLVFISTIVLARLLVPEYFGLMAICLIAIQYLDILNGAGVGSAIIQRRDRIEEAANAALLIGALSGLLLFAGAWVAAPVLAAFFREDEVTNLFRVLAIVIPISAIGAVPSALIQRSLRFKAKFVPDMGRSIAKGSLSILLAWQGFGVWSLVYGQIAGEVVATVILLILARWRPTRKFDWVVTRQILRFGSHIIGVGVAGALVINVDYLLVGRLLGAAALGYYTIAYRIPELVIRNTNYVIARVAFPLLSQVQTDSARLRSVYGTMLKYVSLFAFPSAIGLALIAQPFIRTFYTEKWEPSIPVMQLIAIALGISAVGHLPGIIYKAINRPEILNQLSVIKLVVTIAVLWVSIRWGIAGVAAGQVVLSIIFVIVDSVIVSRVLAFPVGRMVVAIRPALCGALAMGIAVGTLNVTVHPGGVAGLVLLVSLAVSVYTGSLLLISRDTILEARTVLRSAMARA